MQSITLRKLYNFLTQHLPRAATLNIWPTKSFEIWFFLQFLLMVEKPNKLIEIGSGRSTHFLAEYNQKFSKQFYSIEENYMFLLRNWLALKLSFINDFKLIYVPLKNGWFDIKKLNSLKFLKNADFLFIDAPGGSLNVINKSSRCSKIGLNFLLNNYKKTNSIIIDDLQSEEVYIFCKVFLSNREDLFYILLKYRMDRLILFCIDRTKKEKYLQFLDLTNINQFLVYKSNNYEEMSYYLKANSYIIE